MTATRLPRLSFDRLEDRATPATFTVTTLHPTDPGSITEAVGQANADTEPDTIVFAPGLAGGTIEFGGGTDFSAGASYLAVRTPITIRGSGQTFGLDNDANLARFFVVYGPSREAAGDLTLRDLTLAGTTALGNADAGWGADGRGGAVLNLGGTVRVERCTLTGNRAWGDLDNSLGRNAGDGLGGAIANIGGALVVVDSTLDGNTAEGGTNPNGAVAGNGLGGAVYNDGGTVVIADSTIAGNTALGGADGNDITGGGDAFGGGLYNLGGEVTLTNVTFAGNAVTGGTGGNTSLLGGAAGDDLYNTARDESTVGIALVGNSVFAGRTGAGPVPVADGPAPVANVLVAGSNGTRITGTGPNIVSAAIDNRGGTVDGVAFTVADPVLGPLQDNGGPTRTMAPAAGSPAVDGGDRHLLTPDNFGGEAPAADQRGAGFPRVGNGRVDLGAVEFAGPSLTIFPETLEDGRVGDPYGRGLETGAEEETAAFAVTAGALPPGLAIQPGFGRFDAFLNGTPTAAGTFTFTLTATEGGATGSREYTVAVLPARVLTLTPETLPGGRVGDPYGVTVFATGSGSGHPDYQFAVTAGALPPGLAVVDDPGDPESEQATLVGTPTAAGTFAFTLTATEGGLTASRAYTVVVAPAEGPPSPPPPPAPIPQPIAVGGSLNGRASVYTPVLPTGRYEAVPIATADLFGAAANVRTAVGDVDGDGTLDTVMVTGPGVPTRFAVVSGKDHATVLVPPRAPFEGSEDFTGGGLVTAADLDGDGKAEVVLTPDFLGGPRVVAFALRAGGGVDRVANFLGIEDAAFRGGCRAALGDVNADGAPDLAVTAGFPGGPRAAVWDGRTLLGAPARLVNDFFAFDGADVQTLRHGAFVAAGDVDGDRFADLIFGGGPGGAPRVFVLSGKMVAAGDVVGAQAAPVANFYVAGNSSDRLGVRVGATDADRDGRADVVAGTGERTAAGVRVYLGKDVTPGGEPAAFQDLDPFARSVLANGVFVG